MKPIRFSKVLAQSKILRSLSIALVAPAIVMTMTSAQAGTTSAPAETSSSEAANWIGFTIGGAFVSGDQAGMMRRTQTNGDFYGGIESLQYTKALNSSTTLTLDGHALPGLEDYEGNLTLTKNDVGYIKTGYKQFRTWYDGKGGYLDGAMYQSGVPAWGDELSIDRGQFYIEAGLRMDKLPEITFSYKHDFRNGQKDSLTWGEGVPTQTNVVPASTNQYKLAPSFWDIDEKVDTFELNAEHTLGNTDLGLGLVYEHTGYTNVLTNTRGYLDSSPPAPASSTNAYREVSQTNESSTDLFAGNIHSVTRFNDNVWLSAGFAYDSIDNNTDGYRSINSSTPTYTGSTTRAETYRNMVGDGDLSEITGNLSLMWVAVPDLTLTPSLRYEHKDQTGSSSLTYYLPQTPSTILGYPSQVSDTQTDDTLGALDIRYTGLANWVLFTKGQWGQINENIKWADTTAANGIPRATLYKDIQIDERDYSLGANWYPTHGLSFAVEGLYSERDQALDPFGNGINGTGSGSNVVGSQGGSMNPVILEHDTQLYDFNLRMTWRPLSNLSLVTRYDYGQTEYENKGTSWTPTTGGTIPSGLPQIESGKMSSNILSESITWSPTAQFYLQATGSYVWAKTETSFSGITNSDDNYFTGSLSAGYAIDDKTQVTGTFTYYGASNYNAYPGAMGYGLNTQEYGASVALTRLINPNVIWSLRYGFYTSNTQYAPDQSNGASDFTAQMVSTSLQVRF